MWPWRVKMPTQNLLRLLLLLMLVIRIVLATVCCRFGSWGYRLWLEHFGQDFVAEVWSVFCFWCLVGVMKLNFRFWSFNLVEIWLRSWSWCLVEILKMYQDLCRNLWYDPKKSLWEEYSTLGYVVPLAMFVLANGDEDLKVLFLPKVEGSKDYLLALSWSDGWNSKLIEMWKQSRTSTKDNES